MMEMHYDNPKLLSGRRDSSGQIRTMLFFFWYFLLYEIVLIFKYITSQLSWLFYKIIQLHKLLLMLIKSLLKYPKLHRRYMPGTTPAIAMGSGLQNWTRNSWPSSVNKIIQFACNRCDKLRVVCSNFLIVLLYKPM